MSTGLLGPPGNATHLFAKTDTLDGWFLTLSCLSTQSALLWSSICVLVAMQIIARYCRDVVPLQGDWRGSRRAGFTVIELLVVIAVLGLLVALLLPAVQSSREAARRIGCSSNMRQIGLATNAYESDWSIYPVGNELKVRLLPYLEQQALYELCLSEPLEFGPTRTMFVPVYVCPSDAIPPLETGIGSANYVGCYGSGVLDYGYNGMFSIDVLRTASPVVGMEPRRVKAAEVTDGLSNTAMISEILRQSGRNDDILRVVYTTPNQYSFGDGRQLTAACDQIPVPPSSGGWIGITIGGRGTPWFDGNYGKGLYNHALGPNRPSCNNNTHLATGVHTAASMHPGGVNLLFVDDHLRFVSSGVDIGVWQALSSRSGNDLTEQF